jgi:hypothetical protein
LWESQKCPYAAFRITDLDEQIVAFYEPLSFIGTGALLGNEASGSYRENGQEVLNCH